jgi:hypothetical protein
LIAISFGEQIMRSKLAIVGGTCAALGLAAGVGITLFLRLHISLSGSEKVHRLLEDLYFIAGIAIALLAAIGLRQLTLTRSGLQLTQSLAQDGQRREALKLATDQCRYFAEMLLPEWKKLNERLAAGAYRHVIQGVDLLNPRFTVKNNFIAIPNFDQKRTLDELHRLEAIDFMNLIEAFAIFFGTGMATDDVGYYETGIPFLQIMQQFMPAFLAIRQAQSGRYLSAVSLYERWQARYIKEQLTFIRNTLDERIKTPATSSPTTG